MASAICPPFDVISPEEQGELYARSPVNAVRIELADVGRGDRYEQASRTLSEWRENGTLAMDDAESFYVYRQTFAHGESTLSRTILFARVRLAPWEAGDVLPHEQTFGGPKEDRLKLLHAIRMNTSPIYLLYRDAGGRVAAGLDEAMAGTPEAAFSSPDGQEHAVWQIEESKAVADLQAALASETLFVADGHHRYETALAYRDEIKAASDSWTGDEAENFVMVALTAADDPGLLVLPIHRVTNVSTPPGEALARMDELFEQDGDDPSIRVVSREGSVGLAVKAPGAVDALLRQDRSAEWRGLDYSIANHVVLQHCLGVPAEKMRDYATVWFVEDGKEATDEVKSGKATYAVLMKPVSVGRVLELAEGGERMPQKSTFFYPKVPTGIVFNLLQA
jgi:uncharacterized protein (DUF1015 family)